VPAAAAVRPRPHQYQYQIVIVLSARAAQELPFHSSRSMPVSGSVGLAAMAAAKGCNDQAWPDGDGAFHLAGATPKTVQELLDEFNSFDWTEGIELRQARVAPLNASACDSKVLGDVCYPEKIDEADRGTGEWSTAAFGYNWTHGPTHPLDNPWVYYSAAELGADESGPPARR
jgi:hypothetical protein